MPNVFTKLNIAGRYRGGAVISWELHPSFPVTGPLTFTVEASRSGVGDFVDIGQVVDTFAFTDPNRWIYGKDARLHYRVSTESGGDTQVSAVKQALGNFNARDQGIVRSIIQKEDLRNSLAGQCGLLYKRRRWGVKCPECLDYNTGEVTNPKCTICFGTGFTGGYFDPVEYFVTASGPDPSRRRMTDMTRGQVNQRVMVIRGLNCPWLDSGDVWVDSDSDERYVVHAISNIDYRGIAIIFDPVEMRLAPSTDIIYELARP